MRASANWSHPFDLRRFAWFLLAASLLMASCADESEPFGSWLAGREDYGSPEDGVAGDWGDIAAGSSVADSEWGARAALELITTIGGPGENRPEYFFNNVKSMSVGPTRIYVLDGAAANQVVHAFDFRGTHTGLVGRQGEGPGEYGEPREITTDSAGHLWVRDRMSFLEFDANGAHLQSTRTDTRSTLVDDVAFVVADDGSVLLSAVLERLGPAPYQRKWSIVTYAGGDPRGALNTRPVPYLGFEARRIELQLNERNTFIIDAPFFPGVHWAVAPSGAIAIGIANGPLIDLHYGGASQATQLELRGQASAIADGEGNWYRRSVAALIKRAAAASGWLPGRDALPLRKPFFAGIAADDRDRFWVIRAGRGKRWSACNDAAETVDEFRASPCWEDTYSMDAFRVDGTYVGTVALPVGAQLIPHPVVRQDLVLIHVKGRDGNSILHLYRLIVPD